MLNTPPPTSFVQRFSRHAVIGMCLALLVGMVGTAVVQGHDESEGQAKVRFVEPIEIVTTPAARPEVIAVEHEHKAGDHAAKAVIASVAQAPETATLVVQPRTIQMEVTAYCACTKCCGKNAQGITASGKRVSYNNGRFVAADTRVLPFGQKLIIPGYASDQPVEVIDRGGAIKGNKLDVYFDSHQEALEWGRQKLTVTIVE